MDKLLHIRNVQLVRVNRELVVAGKLAERNASFSEATERLELLQELAGKFWRTQESIEGRLDNPESIATARKVAKEFEAAYQAAKQLLENYVINTKPVRAVPSKPSSGSLQDEIRRFCEEVKEWNNKVVKQLRLVPGKTSELDRYHLSSNCTHLGPTTTTTEILSGAVGSGDPEGKELPSCAPVSDPTVAQVTATGGKSTTNCLPLPEKHRPSIGVLTFHPDQASCGNGKDGPETSTEDVAMASAGFETGTYTARAHPGHLEVQHDGIEPKMEIESGGAQRKTRIQSTDPIGVTGSVGSLLRTSRQPKVHGVSSSSGKSVLGERSGESLVSQPVKDCDGVRLEFGSFSRPTVPSNQLGYFKRLRINSKHKSRKPRQDKEQTSRTVDSRFREQRKLHKLDSADGGVQLFWVPSYQRQVPVEAGEGKGLMLKVLHTEEEESGAVLVSDGFGRDVYAVGLIRLRHTCLKVGENVPVTRIHIRDW